MRKLASVLCLLALCLTSASAQSWNLAQDPASSLILQSTVTFNTVLGTAGVQPELVQKGGTTIDEIFIYRTSTGGSNLSLSSVAIAPSGTLLESLSHDAEMVVHGKAAVMSAVANGAISQPSLGVAKAKVWHSTSGIVNSMSFEVRWDAAGGSTVTRVPDEVVSGAVN